MGAVTRHGLVSRRGLIRQSGLIYNRGLIWNKSGYPSSLMLYLSGLKSLVGPELTTSLVTGTDLLYDDGTVYIGPSFTGGSEGYGFWPEIADGVTQVSTAATVNGNGYSVGMPLGMMSFFALQDSGTVEFTVQMGVSSADITEDQNLFTICDTVTGGLYRSAGGVINFAGASYTVPEGWLAGETLKIQVKKETGMVSVGVGDVFGTAVTFAAFANNTGTIRLGFLTTAQFGFGDIKIYNDSFKTVTESQYVVHWGYGDNAISQNLLGNSGTEGVIFNGIVDFSSLSYTAVSGGTYVNDVGANFLEIYSALPTTNSRIRTEDIPVTPEADYTLDFEVDNLNPGDTTMYIAISDSSGYIEQINVTENTPQRISFTTRTGSYIYIIFYATSSSVISGARYSNLRLLEGDLPDVEWDSFSAGNQVYWDVSKTCIDTLFSSSGVPFSYTDKTNISTLSSNYGDQVLFDLEFQKVLFLNAPYTPDQGALVASYMGGNSLYPIKSDYLQNITLEIPYADSPLSIPNPYPTGEIHPKLLDFETTWNGYRYWMAYTPYPDGTYENPCILCSNDLITWDVPPGVTNPLFPAPVNTSEYNSDTHLLYREDINQLEVWWKVGGEYPHEWERMTSSDGSVWSAMEIVWEGSEIVSPCPYYEDGKYKVFAIYSGQVVFTECTDFTDWSSIDYLDVSLDDINFWHLDTIKTDLGTEFLIQAYDDGETNNTADLYWSIMTEAGTFTPVRKVLAHNTADVSDPAHLGIYRSTFIKTGANTYTIIYTGIGNSGRTLCLTYGTLINYSAP